MTTITILIYTDTADITDADAEASWGVTILKNLLETRGPAFAKVELRVVNRFRVPETPERISPALLNGVDQLWLFGTYQGEAAQEFDDTFGGRDNELNPEEIQHLKGWMQEGGVLIAGDHANPDPMLPKDSPEDTYLCLGRALGHKVPRAGKLREWKGPPTLNAASSFSTIVNTPKSDPADLNAQGDESPQKLLPVLNAQGEPHRLFMGKNAQGKPRLLDLFPDHGHEGRVILPKPPHDEKEWPPAGNPFMPEVIANGCDKRSCGSGAVLAAYDGDAVGVGRIVADSSWHHYFNINLAKLENTVSLPTVDLLAQFYSNLAVWLAPSEKRVQMSKDMFDWMMKHPEVKEELANHPTEVGKVALKFLSNKATPCEILELIQTGLPADMRADNEPLNFPRLDDGIRPLPPLEMVIGSILSQRYASARERLQAAASDSPPAARKSNEQIVGEGVAVAFSLHAEGLERNSAAAADFLSRLGGSN